MTTITNGTNSRTVEIDENGEEWVYVRLPRDWVELAATGLPSIYRQWGDLVTNPCRDAVRGINAS